MKLNYEKKYKERAPEETIKLIKKFFEDKHCTIKQEVQKESSQTWSAQLRLYLDDIKIASSNGKGTSELFCLASAHAELYERFANKTFTLSSWVLNQKINQISFKENGFYFSPNEKELSFEEAFDSVNGKYYLKNMCDNPSDLKTLFSLVFNNQFIGIPYKNVVTNETFYIDPRLSMCFNLSSGMAAGNDFYEAFVQGMSEIYEHFVTGRYYTNMHDTYYMLNLNNITNDTINNIIGNIKKDNDLYIIDMSYIYNIPVLMSILVNKRTHAIATNIGSSPIFEIALERVLTELYQGIYSYNDLKSYGQFPAKDFCDPRVVDAYWPGCTMTKLTFPEHILNNLTLVENYNSQIFLSGEYSNQELYNYVLAINQKLNWDVYYYNCSLMDQMYAIKIYVRNLPYLLQDFSFGPLISNKTEKIQFIIKIYLFINNYLNNDKFNLKDVIELTKYNQLFINKLDSHYINNILMQKNQFVGSAGFSNTQNTIELMEKFLYNYNWLLTDSCDMYNFYNQNAEGIYKKLVAFGIISRYLNSCQHYSSDEIIKIFNFLNLSYSLEDIEAYENKDINYLIQNIALADLNAIKSGKYDNYITMIAKCGWTN